MSFIDRIIGYKREEAEFKRKEAEYREKADKALKEGRTLVHEVYAGMALRASKSAERANEFAETIKRHKKENNGE